MGELKNRADSLERNIVQIVREIDEQKKKVENLAGEIRFITDKAEKMEEENVGLKKQIDDQERRFEKEKADLMKQK